MKTISKEEAKSQGLATLTTPYNLPQEKWMLENVVNDMNRGGIRHAVVQTQNGVEVWRANIKQVTDKRI